MAHGSFKVSLDRVSFARTDGAQEDTPQTWASVVLVTRGRANNALWYAAGDDAVLSKTPVRVARARGAAGGAAGVGAPACAA
jgi:hypothetical protein